MATPRFPVFFVSHGGGPWPWMEDRRRMFEKTAREFAALPQRLPGKPKAAPKVKAKPLGGLKASAAKAQAAFAGKRARGGARQVSRSGRVRTGQPAKPKR